MSGSETASSWLNDATIQAILAYFGADYGATVVGTIDTYLNGLPTQSALAIAQLINTYAVEDAGIVYNFVPAFGVDRYVANEDGVAYIDTGYKPNNNYSWSLRCALIETSVAEKGLFGQFTGQRRMFLSVQNDYFQSGYGNYFNENIKSADLIMHEWKQISNTLYCDGVQVAQNPALVWEALNPLYLLSRYGLSPIKNKLVRADITISSTISSTYYPFVRNGVVGMIDIVQNVFKAPAAGVLTLGVQSV